MFMNVYYKDWSLICKFLIFTRNFWKDIILLCVIIQNITVNSLKTDKANSIKKVICESFNLMAFETPDYNNNNIITFLKENIFFKFNVKFKMQTYIQLNCILESYLNYRLNYIGVYMI